MKFSKVEPDKLLAIVANVSKHVKKEHITNYQILEITSDEDGDYAVHLKEGEETYLYRFKKNELNKPFSVELLSA